MSRARCVKHRYPDRIAAQLALTRIDRTNATKSECRAYRCANCCGWHLTSQPKAPASLIPACGDAPPPSLKLRPVDPPPEAA